MRQHYRMDLDSYLRETRQTFRAFGLRLGRHGSEVFRWARGQRTPDLRTALEIERLTEGAVKPRDFVEIPGPTGKHWEVPEANGRK
jgi:hypothetical protein